MWRSFSPPFSFLLVNFSLSWCLAPNLCVHHALTLVCLPLWIYSIITLVCWWSWFLFLALSWSSSTCWLMKMMMMTINIPYFIASNCFSIIIMKLIIIKINDELLTYLDIYILFFCYMYCYCCFIVIVRVWLIFLL